MRVPDKSFGLDRSEEAETEKNVARWEDEAKRRVLVMKGSRMQAFDWATDSLLKAATELENGIRKETKYWHEILSIAEKGWPIQRTRRDARTAPFAVRYGLPEGRSSNDYDAYVLLTL
jgi:mediator of RNA polymerase II transcription subunit 17